MREFLHIFTKFCLTFGTFGCILKKTWTEHGSVPKGPYLMPALQYQFPTFAEFTSYVAQVCGLFESKFGQPMGSDITVTANGQALQAMVFTPFYNDGNGNMEQFLIGFTNANVVPASGMVDTINMTLAYAAQNDQRSPWNPNPPFVMLKPQAPASPSA